MAKQQAKTVVKSRPTLVAQAPPKAEKAHKLSGSVLMDMATEHPDAKRFRFGHGETPEYKVKPNEKFHVHIEWDPMLFSKSGTKTSLPEKIITRPRQWNFMRKTLVQRGARYIRILYAPESTNVKLLMNKSQFDAFDKSIDPVYIFPQGVDLIKDEKPKTRRDKAVSGQVEKAAALKKAALKALEE